MTAVITVKLDTRQLERIAKDLNSNVDDVIGTLAYQLEGYAKAIVPVKTANLKNSIESKRVKINHWQVNVWADYGIHVEFGTYKMRAQPFLVPGTHKVLKDLNSGKTWARLFIV